MTNKNYNAPNAKQFLKSKIGGEKNFGKGVGLGKANKSADGKVRTVSTRSPAKKIAKKRVEESTSEDDGGGGGENNNDHSSNAVVVAKKCVDKKRVFPGTAILRSVVSGSDAINLYDTARAEALIGALVVVYWPDFGNCYIGKVRSYREKKQQHVVYYYNDQETVVHDLKDEKWCLYSQLAL
jgi:hypothetical protein